MRDQDRIAEAHLISIVEHTSDLCRRIRRIGVRKVLLPTALDDGNIPVHDHIFCAGQPQNLRAAGVVVPVGMADEQNPDIAEMEAELLNAIPDERDRLLQARVDQHIALWGDDQIRRKVFAADVVEIVSNAEGRDGGRPVGILLGAQMGA
jgi:hypothetical protein